MAKNTTSTADSTKLMQETSKVLYDKLKMTVKGWAISRRKPPPEITKDGEFVELGGMLLYTESDLYTLNLPSFCFDKKKRGKKYFYILIQAK